MKVKSTTSLDKNRKFVASRPASQEIYKRKFLRLKQVTSDSKANPHMQRALVKIIVIIKV